MTLIDRHTFDDREHAALRMPPCQASRIVRATRHDFLRALHPTGYRDLRARVTDQDWNVRSTR